MYRRLDSPEGARFLALIHEGMGLKPSARAAGGGGTNFLAQLPDIRSYVSH